MTAAVGVAEDGDVVLGIDSCTTDGDHLFDLANKGPTSHAVNGHPDLLIASAGLRSISDELAWRWAPPMPESEEPLRFLADCAVSLRGHFTAEPLWKMVKADNHRLDGHLIAAWRGTVVEIDSVFGVSQPRNGEVTIGSGRALALGALAATKGRPAEERVRVALEAAAEYSDSVAGPFTIRWAGRS